MLSKILVSLFNRDLNKLQVEINSYKDEKKIWLISENIANSGGNLCLHLIGNLKTYIGKEFGKTDYVRNRELEFSAKDVPRTDLIRMIEETIIVINNALENITDETMDTVYPLIVLEEKTTVGYFMVHLATHLNYHLGQINYHRRLLDK
jgi:hypothetical protein